MWEAYQQGDHHSFALLFRRYYEPLVQYGNKFNGNRDILEDCIQELFTELWQHKSQTQVQSVKAYLFKSLKYKLYRAHQRKMADPFNENHSDVLFELSHETLLVGREQDAEKTARVLQALGQLSNRQKEIIYLKFYQELNYEEVSEIMNINYQAARNLLYQSIKSLKKLLTTLSAFLFF
ncbi:RNA polymerase sigma factor [Niastella yeongjuensis]|uniref:RNA polymerase sigma factor n=1 Tax=Niastella yeongjuensis TaxID=354355 RepID=UPI0015A6E0FB|nr:sigma-70 family RNA polymerase sigma factor [Niastella yeongjuensis]